MPLTNLTGAETGAQSLPIIQAVISRTNAQDTEIASAAAAAAGKLSQSQADARYVRTVNGSAPDGAGNVTVSGGGSAVTVENVLNSTSTVNALSAAQGKALKDTADALAATVSGKATAAQGAKADTALQSVPVASASVLGGIKAGSGITIAGDGTASVSGGGTSVAISAPTTLTAAAHDGNTLFCAGNPTLTINDGAAIKRIDIRGACAFAGTADVTDDRKSGDTGVPWCSLVSGPTADTYYVMGSRA